MLLEKSVKSSNHRARTLYLLEAQAEIWKTDTKSTMLITVTYNGG